MTAHATTILVPLVDRIRARVKMAAELGLGGETVMFTLDEMADVLEQHDKAVTSVDVNQARVAQLRGIMGRAAAVLAEDVQ